jgi:hypothetical protein
MMGDNQIFGCFLRVLHNGKLLFVNAVLTSVTSTAVGPSTDFLLLHPLSCALYRAILMDNKLNIYKEHIKSTTNYVNI